MYCVLQPTFCEGSRYSAFRRASSGLSNSKSGGSFVVEGVNGPNNGEEEDEISRLDDFDLDFLFFFLFFLLPLDLGEDAGEDAGEGAGTDGEGAGEGAGWVVVFFMFF